MKLRVWVEDYRRLDLPTGEESAAVTVSAKRLFKIVQESRYGSDVVSELGLDSLDYEPEEGWREAGCLFDSPDLELRQRDTLAGAVVASDAKPLFVRVFSRVCPLCGPELELSLDAIAEISPRRAHFQAYVDVMPLSSGEQVIVGVDDLETALNSHACDGDMASDTQGRQSAAPPAGHAAGAQKAASLCDVFLQHFGERVAGSGPLSAREMLFELLYDAWRSGRRSGRDK